MAKLENEDLDDDSSSTNPAGQAPHIRDDEKELSDEGTEKDRKAELLDSEGDLSLLFNKALIQIFTRFSSLAQKHSSNSSSNIDQTTKQEQGGGDSAKSNVESGEQEIGSGFGKLVLSEEELDEFTKAVNDGEVMSKESKDEMKEYLDVDEKGNLTFDGFCEMYHLQSGSDADETWKDLKALGYNDQLQLIVETSSE